MSRRTGGSKGPSSGGKRPGKGGPPKGGPSRGAGPGKGSAGGRGRGSGPAERGGGKAGTRGKGPAGGAQRSGPPRRGPGRSAGDGSSVRHSDRDRKARPSATTSRYGLGGDQVEGRQAVRELLLAGTRKVREIMMAEDLDPAPVLDDIRQLAREQRVTVTELGRKALDRRSYTESSQGVVAEAAELKPVDLEELVAHGGAGPGSAPFLLALDGVTDPRNLGALLRTAECAGVDGVILPRHRAAHITPSVTKTAAGAIEHLPMALVGGLPAAIESLRSAGVWVVGLDSTGSTSLYDLTVATQPICLVAGAEGKGLSRLVERRCDEVVSLPLRGSLDSLNVAAAVAVATYEIARRRSANPTGPSQAG